MDCVHLPSSIKLRESKIIKMKKENKQKWRTTAWMLIATSAGVLIRHTWGTEYVISSIIILAVGMWLYSTDDKAG